MPFEGRGARAGEVPGGGPPARGIHDTVPATRWEDALLGGNGCTGIMVLGDPHDEVVFLNDHRFVWPNGTRDLEPPLLAGRLDEVRGDLLAGRWRRAHQRFCAGWKLRWTQPFHPGPKLALSMPRRGPVEGYRRSVDFETGEIAVAWHDDAGHWLRRSFVSRADGLVVQHLAAPAGESLDVTVSFSADLDRVPDDLDHHVEVEALRESRRATEGATGGAGAAGGAGEAMPVLRFRATYPPGLGAHAYGASTLAVPAGGTWRAEGAALRVTGTRSLLLLTGLWRAEDADGGEEAGPGGRDWASALREAGREQARREAGGPGGSPAPSAPGDGIDRAGAAYARLLARHAALHGAAFGRVRLQLGGDGGGDGEMDGVGAGGGQGMPVADLVARQLADPGRLDAALLERLFDSGRYLLLSASGVLPPRLTGLWTGEWEPGWCGDFTTDGNVNLQVAGCNVGALPEVLQAYANLVLGQLDHWRVNARNLYGARGLLAPTRTDGESGFMFHFDEGFPGHAWTAGADWLLYPLWEHWLVTGDGAFLRDRLAPALRELALFYEDFLVRTDGDGRVVFAPSYSPENAPASTGVSTAVNATMDVAAGKHALRTAIEACDQLGIEQGPGEGVARWRALLDRLPDYRVNGDGALAEWAWPGLDDDYEHRHVSHLYPVWPLHEITPDGTPALAEAARRALLLRGDENDSAHGGLHRALAWARLGEAEQAAANLRKVLGADMLHRSLMTSHYPGRSVYNADAANAIPAVLIELLVQTRPGVVELLPALPAELPRGRLTGIRGLGRVHVTDLRWDLTGGTVTATLDAATGGDVTVTCRRGIAGIATAVPVAPSPLGRHARVVSLPAGRDVVLTIELPPS